MEIWKFFDITHREHTLCNPMSIEKFERLINLLSLKPDARALDIASGKGEFLIRLAERYPGITGTGIDLSPFCIAEVRKKQQARVPGARLRFVEMDGAQYVPETPESYDITACIGASWIYGGHRGTLKALFGMAAPNGWIVVGEPYWRQEPPREYLEALGESRDNYGTHHENVEAGQELGLEAVYTLVSSHDEWDHYEGLQWYAAEAWAGANPDDPDVDDLLKRVRGGRAAYLKWGRDTLGWAIYVFRKR